MAVRLVGSGIYRRSPRNRRHTLATESRCKAACCGDSATLFQRRAAGNAGPVCLECAFQPIPVWGRRLRGGLRSGLAGKGLRGARWIRGLDSPGRGTCCTPFSGGGVIGRRVVSAGCKKKKKKASAAGVSDCRRVVSAGWISPGAAEFKLERHGGCLHPRD